MTKWMSWCDWQVGCRLVWLSLLPTTGEANLIGRPLAQSLPRAQSPGQTAGAERGRRGDDDAHHDHRIPIADGCSIRSGVSVAARLR
ncbi:hypothetical protein [Streptomyces collinus]|uniref:hypothetical protein n=1 Tax=Streptomyces collinus TaxID=42684 RepID=UPI0038033FC6